MPISREVTEKSAWLFEHREAGARGGARVGRRPVRGCLRKPETGRKGGPLAATVAGN